MSAFFIVGTGNMAWFLGKSLCAQGWTCNGVLGRNQDHARQLSEELRCPVLTSLSDIPDSQSLVCFLAVNDSSISELAAQLSFKETILIHTSGTAPVSAIQKSLRHAVLWPVYSLVKTSLPRHKDIPMAYQSAESCREEVIRIAAALSNLPFEVTETQRNWLHLTAVFANNFINHLVTLTKGLCTAHDIPFESILPLLLQTFEPQRLERSRELQTGPARRADGSTIERQIQMLQHNESLLRIYQSITDSITGMYRQ